MNIENLKTLANFLDTLPQEKFDMTDFARDEYGEQMVPATHECTTVGCAVGWGPAAGIEVERSDKDYFDYAGRAFGTYWHSSEFDWCFHGDWALIDNTPAGAAKRIRHLIEHGVPEDADDQLRGEAHYVFA